MSDKIVTICQCESCGESVKIPIRLVGQIMSKMRKNKPSSEFMSKIAKKRYENKNQSNKQRLDDKDHPNQE